MLLMFIQFDVLIGMLLEMGWLPVTGS
jgi:hypothetical protein